MIDTLEFYEELKKTLEPEAARTIAELLGKLYRELSNTVTKAEFEKLIGIVSELAKGQREMVEAQKKSEEKLTRLETTVGELAEAQKKSEERLTRLETAVEELAEAQKKSEERLTRLEAAVEELAEAQKKSEERLTRLEAAVEELAEAQKRTEQSLNRLIKRVDVIEERLEGISNSVGYSLENIAYTILPRLLSHEGVQVSGRIIRRYYGENQINIWGKGTRKGKEVLLLGEVKVRPSKSEINRFLKIADEIKKKENKEVYLLFVAHDYHPNTEKYLKEKGIKYYWSYELEK